MNRQHKENGGAHLIVISIVGVLLIIAALVYVYITSSNKSADNKDSSVATSQVSDDETEEPIVSNDGYLVLSDWRVRSKLVDGLGEVKYYKRDANGVTSYHFTTARVEELGGMCRPESDGADFTSLAILSRYDSEQQFTASPPAVSTNSPIDGKYYYVSLAQSSCSVNETDPAIQIADRDKLNALLMALEVDPLGSLTPDSLAD